PNRLRSPPADRPRPASCPASASWTAGRRWQPTLPPPCCLAASPPSGRLRSSDVDGRLRRPAAESEPGGDEGPRNRILFGDAKGGPSAKPRRFGDYRPIGDDRTGSNRLNVLQFGSGAEGWRKIGEYSAAAGLQMQRSLDSVQAKEKPAARAACRQRADCSDAESVVCVNLTPAVSPPPAASNAHLALLLLLLLLPAGICAGYFSNDIWLWMRQKCQKLRKQPPSQQPQPPQVPSFELDTIRSQPPGSVATVPAPPPPQQPAVPATSSLPPAPMPRRQRQSTGASAGSGARPSGSYAEMQVEGAVQSQASRQTDTYENDT
uniref:Conserved plasma membrane protein n=1 Tax=Macrostomum lignano TaxID=282301 RepID=A0A1I8IJH9_9PLAT